LDLEKKVWYKPDIEFKDFYTAKRFHTVNSINDTQIVSFGGCHSEYAHLNEMHIFDLTSFLENPDSTESRIHVTRVNITEGAPSTRWGHAATTYQGKLYILGGRNEQDICDVHEFDPFKNKWTEIEIADPKPKPRRRHSALFISGSLIMFGGFDGNFFNDVNILSLKKENNTVAIPKSTVSEDYFSLVNNPEGSDISFKLNDPSRTSIYGHRALILFRLLQREISVDLNENMPLQTMVASNKVPDFIKKVSQVQIS
jgi:N-acetylneuraminic acid mutarotase